jgi:hypothetical protein
LNDWLDTIAERAQTDASTVQDILTRYRVEARPSRPRPRRLLLQRLEFAGTKKLPEHAPETFAFGIDLDHGVWCFGSRESNLVGKTSILEIIRWALTGRAYPQQDVQGWLERVHLHARIDEEHFEVPPHLQFSDARPSAPLARPDGLQLARRRSSAPKAIRGRHR